MDTLGFRGVVRNPSKGRGRFANLLAHVVFWHLAAGLILFGSSETRAAGAGFFSVKVHAQGSGAVSIDPRAEFYTAGSEVTLAAHPGRWYGFSRWSDGSTANPRSLTVSADTALTVIFTNTVPLETTRYKTRQWDHSYGGELDDRLQFLLPTADDGWILAGNSSSTTSDGKTTAGCGDSDFWILRIDGDGRTVWEQSFGGADRERLAFVQATGDGDLLLGGYSNSGLECTKGEGAFGQGDFWILKISPTGDKIWERVLGGTGSEQFPICRPTPDGGAIVGGYSDSGTSGNKTTAGLGGYDYWVVKLGGSGETEWEQTLGGSGDDFLSCILPTPDGGFLVGGSSVSPTGGTRTSGGLGGFDFWVVKLASDGGLEWDRSYGGAGDDILSFMEPCSDGGAILAGYSSSDASGNKLTGGFGDYDYWVVRISSIGTPIWDSTFGGAQTEVLTALLPIGADRFLLGGNSESSASGNKTTTGYGASDFWVVAISPDGTKQWEQTFGGAGDDTLLSMQSTQDGGFVLGGYSVSSRSGNKLLNGLGAADYWIVKTDANGVRQWEQELGGPGEDVLYSVQETRTGDLVCAGYSESEIGPGKQALDYGGVDYWVVKLVSLEQPVGTPLVFVNNQWVPSGPVIIGDLAEIRMEGSFSGGTVFYTLDGSTPGTNSTPYAGPFTTEGSITVRALAVSADGASTALADPVDVTVLPTYHLNVTVPGGGAVTLNPPYGPYLSNTVVTVSAVADPGWMFLRWTDDRLNSESSIDLTMNRDQAFGAIFGTRVTVKSDATGEAQIDPDTPLHPYNSLVRLTAFPSPGYYFTVWEGGMGLIGSANPVELPVTVGNFSLIARFAPLGPNQASLVVPVAGAGTVRADPAKDYYDLGESVTLTAVASAGQVFVGWDLDGTGYDNPLIVTVDQSKAIRARFMASGFHVGADSVASDGFHLTVVGTPGSSFQIERSSDLVQWSLLETRTNAPPLSEIVDPDLASVGGRFYRLKPIP